MRRNLCLLSRVWQLSFSWRHSTCRMPVRAKRIRGTYHSIWRIPVRVKRIPNNVCCPFMAATVVVPYKDAESACLTP